MKTWLGRQTNLSADATLKKESGDPYAAAREALEQAVATTGQMYLAHGDSLDLGSHAKSALSHPDLARLTDIERVEVFSEWLTLNLDQHVPLSSMVRAALGWPTSCAKVSEIPSGLMTLPEPSTCKAWKEAFRPDKTRPQIESMTSRGKWHARRNNHVLAAADFGCALVYVRQNRQTRGGNSRAERCKKERELFAQTLEHLATHRDESLRRTERTSARLFPKLLKYLDQHTFAEGPLPLLAASVVQRLIAGDKDGQKYTQEAQTLWLWLGNALQGQKAQAAETYYQTVQEQLGAATLTSPVLPQQKKSLEWAGSALSLDDLVSELPAPEAGWLPLTKLSPSPGVTRFVQGLEGGLTAYRSLLLKGKPGVGKSGLVEAIYRHARAKNPNLYLFRATVQQFLSGTFSQTALNLSQTLERLTNLTVPPQTRQVLIWIDEIDGLAVSRKQDVSTENHRITTTLFPFLDDSQSARTQNLFFVGTTNHPELMDPAILSRFRLISSIDLPDTDLRMGMLDHAFAAHPPLSWTGAAPAIIREVLEVGTDGMTLRSLSHLTSEIIAQQGDGLSLLSLLLHAQGRSGKKAPFAKLPGRERLQALLLHPFASETPLSQAREQAVADLLSLCEEKLVYEALFVAKNDSMGASRALEHLAVELEKLSPGDEPKLISRVSVKPVHIAFPLAQTSLLSSYFPTAALEPKDFRIIVTRAHFILMKYDPKNQVVEQHLFPRTENLLFVSAPIDLSAATWGVFDSPSEKIEIATTKDDGLTRTTTFKRRPARAHSWSICLQEIPRREKRSKNKSSSKT